MNKLVTNQRIRPKPPNITVACSEERHQRVPRLGVDWGMAPTTTAPGRKSQKKLKPKPKTEKKSWETRNLARKEKQAAHAAKLAGETS
jgi:hypothetical protein